MITVLYVDDEKFLLDIGKIYLERTGNFKVDTSTSPIDALKSSSLKSYDAIISDYEMPSMNGIQLLKEVRQQFGDIPFILFTGRGREEVVIQAINNGADFYLQKGGEPQAQFAELIHMIRQAVSKRQAEKSLTASVEELREAASRYEALIAASNTGAWEYHEDTGFLWCSPEYFSMLGRDIKDYDLSGMRNIEQTWVDLLHPDDRERATRHFETYLNNPEGIYEQHFRMLHKDEHWVWIWSRGKTLRDANERPTLVTLGTHIDVTERRKAEEAIRTAEDTYRNIFLNSQIGLYRTDMHSGLLLDVNDTVARFIGYKDRASLLAEPFNIAQRYVDPHDRENMISLLLAHGEFRNYEARFRKNDGSITWMRFSARLVKEKGWIEGVSEEITDRKRAEEMINSAFAEKEILLQEIHHRVKKNIALIISLIDLQIGSLTDPVLISQFRVLKTRIQSIALIHESLYLTKDFAGINVTTYTKDLTRHLFQIYGTGTDIKCWIDMGDLMIPLETAISCGLVMSEIVTNSLRYAFPEAFSCSEQRGEPCTITISLMREGSDYLLRVADNGIGISEGTDLTSDHSPVLFLIRFIVEHQLHGNLEISTERGTAYTIQFQELGHNKGDNDE